MSSSTSSARLPGATRSRRTARRSRTATAPPRSATRSCARASPARARRSPTGRSRRRSAPPPDDDARGDRPRRRRAARDAGRFRARRPPQLVPHAPALVSEDGGADGRRGADRAGRDRLLARRRRSRARRASGTLAGLVVRARHGDAEGAALAAARARAGGRPPARARDAHPVHPRRAGDDPRAADGDREAADGAMIRLGTSLFSLTNEWLSRHYTLEQLVAAVAERGLGPGLEIVGFQSLRSFPAVEEGAASAFRALLERHELEPSCLGSNLDVALRVDRLLTEDEQVDYLAAQIEVARRLGFPVMRVQHRGSTEVLERALPLAERADVRLGVEIHAPLAADHPSVALVVEVIERLG